MQFLRTRVKAKDFKEVEKANDLITVRWDATPEIITIPARKKGGEPVTKESGYLICTERVFREKPSLEELTAEVNADLDIRYKGAQKPTVDVASLFAKIEE